MTWYFGDPWGPAHDEPDRIVPAPIGRPCLHCGELIEAGDQGIIAGHVKYDDQGQATGSYEPQHRECVLRSVFGSVAHIQRKCSCYVAGSECGDDPTISRREAARQAARFGELLLRSGRYP